MRRVIHKTESLRLWHTYSSMMNDLTTHNGDYDDVNDTVDNSAGVGFVVPKE
jgi:hypothetical protein